MKLNKKLMTKKPYLFALAVSVIYQVSVFILYQGFKESQHFGKRALTFLGGDFLSGGFFQGFILFAFLWALLEIFKQRKMVRIEKSGFNLELLSTKDKHVLLPMDLPNIEDKISKLSGPHRRMLFPRVLLSAIAKFKATHSMGETIDVINIQSDLQREFHEASQNNIRYLLWLIPSLGFMGTVVGLSQSLGIAHEGDMKLISTSLGLAFDTTLLALILGAVTTGYYHRLLEEMDMLHATIKDHIVTHFVNKLELKQFMRGEQSSS